jgi:hypothetical protein
MASLKDVNGRVALDEGWPTFSIARLFKAGYVLALEVLKGGIYKFIVFD